MRTLEQSHSAKKCKSGTLWIFLTSNFFAKYQKIDRGTFGGNTKFSNKFSLAKKL